MSNIEAFRNLPDVNFVDKNVEQLLEDMIMEYEEVYFESTGKRKTLAPGDPIRIWLYSQALRVYGAHHLIDFAAKQNLLRYSEGIYLDHLAARIGEVRLPASPSIATVRFALSAIQSSPVGIPRGTRVSPGNNIFFEITEYTEIPAGSTSLDTIVQCTTLGTAGNNFTPGQINILVDPIPFISSVTNITISQGGANIESDSSLSERIFLKPESFSTAGPENAYVYFTKKYSQAIGDVSVSSPGPVEVDVRFILSNGDLPDSALIQGVTDYLSAKNRRPLTDLVTVGAPDQVPYDIEITYYINRNDISNASVIQTAVNNAVNEYKLWQKTKIGRDINPSELIAKIRNAGAKRVEVISPVYTSLGPAEVGIDEITTVIYGGLEDE